MLHILYIIAITAEAMTAALAAGRRDMDWVGVCIIAWITALGGGTIRNLFRASIAQPFIMIAHSTSYQNLLFRWNASPGN